MSESTRLFLTLVGDERAPAELPAGGVLTLGSSRERATFLVEGPGVAGVHCAIGRAKSGGWALRDLGSETGTLVNGERVASVPLGDGDEIRIGARVLLVRASARAAEKPAEALPSIQGYRITRRLGRGATCEVYLGVQVSLARDVALKVLTAKAEADGDFVARFQAEARAAAALNHPNVVTVFDVGASGGVHYLSMEYMDAGTLEERVARAGPLPWRDVVRILKDAAQGLEFAESKGIVHRDLKPANLMQNQAGTTKIADLGLATQVDEVAAGEAGRKVFGTPHFMSPEQVRGERLDARSDIYSLGATAYRLLTGRTPFEGASSRDILRAHLRAEPPPLAERAPDAPPALAELVARMMAKDAAARPPSAGALVRTLAALADEAPAAPARGGLARALAALVVLGLLGAGAWFLLPRGKPHAGPPLAQGEPLNGDSSAGAPGDETDGAADGPGDALGTGANGTPPPEDDDTQLKLFEAEARVAFLELESRTLAPAERAQALRALADTYRGTTTAETARAAADRLAHEDREASAQEQAEAARVASALDALRTRVEGLGADASPAARLAALAAVEPPPELAASEPYAAARAALARGVVDDALARAREALERADGAVAQGDFAAAARELAAVGAGLDGLEQAVPTELLAPDETGASAALAVAAELRAEASARLARLDEDAGAFAQALERADRERIARDLAAADALPADLARLDLARAAERLSALGGELAGERARALMLRWSDDAQRAQAVLGTLARELDGAGWRRNLVTDPRGRRASGYDAVGADAEGILLDVDGQVEKLAWSAFGADPRGLHRLFFDRLVREWSGAERASIAALLRLASVARALALARPALAQQEPAERDPPWSEVFAEAREWATGTDEAAATEREARALAALVEALALASQDRTALATSRVEALLEQHADTLLVTLLSDGSYAPPPPPTAYQPLRPAEEPAEPQDDAETPAAADESEEDGEEQGAGDGQ